MIQIPKENRWVLAILLLAIIAAIVVLSNPFVPAPNNPQNPANNNPFSDLMNPYPRAPEFQGIAHTINAPENFSLAGLRGKVVLVDFWTYSCINCIRTLPYLKAWHERYSDQGLVIVGLHAPEFEFEKDPANVEMAVRQNGIQYPVLLDNDWQTWRAYQNRFWPHKYLVDANGFIRYDHIGEGSYDETEQQIVNLLRERNASIAMPSNPVSGTVSPDFGEIGTPELYLGYDFARQPLGNAEGFQEEQTVSYSIPNERNNNLVYLDGDWLNNADHAQSVSENTAVSLKFKARNLNIVAGAQNPVRLSITIDGEPIPSDMAGADVSNGTVTVSEQRLYSLVEAEDYDWKEISIHVQQSGFMLYTFTFG